MLARSIAILFMAFLTVNCAAQAPIKQVEADDDALGPLLEGENLDDLSAEEFRAAVNNALRKKGRRALVIFEEVNGVNCPVEVRSIDTVCRSDAFDTIDPAVVCRHAYTGSADPNKRDRIVWKSDDGTKFRISFDNQSPCQNDLGTVFRDRAVCRLKNAADLGVETGKAGYFKYNILAEGTPSTNPGCDLDPHFIVRR
jgi:hypothetical protein